MRKKKIIRITTIPLSLKLLLTGQMRFMSNHDFDVLMISADGKEVSEITSSEGCDHIIVPFTRTISPLQDLKCLYQLFKIIRSEKPDIVHTHTPKAGLLGMLTAKICGVKLKIHTIAGLPLMTTKGGKRKLLEFTERVTYWGADYVLPNSNSIMSFVKVKQLTKESKLDIIGKGSSNGIDLERFSKKAISTHKLEEIKSKIGYNTNKKYLLAVGRVVRDKGICELVSSFTMVKELFPELKLVIVGPLEEQRSEELLPENILTIIKNDNDIIHINWSDGVEYYMYLADILVHASYREGFPNVPLQAGAMECPVICSKIPGNIDIISDKKTGLYFEVGNTKQLAEKIIYALSNKKEITQYAQSLRKEIEQNFSRKFIHSELLKFYQEKLA